MDATAPQATTVSESPPSLDPAGLARVLFAVLLFGTYPLALVVPVRCGVSLVFHIAIPSFFLLSLFCIGFLATTPPVCVSGRSLSSRRLGYLPSILLVFYGLLATLSAWRGHTAQYVHAINAIGMLAIPAWFALCPRRYLPRRLTGLLFALWGVQVLHGLVQLMREHEPVLLAGNRNWAATLLAVLTPWAVLGLHRCLGRSRGRTALWAVRLAQAACVALSLLLLYRAQCRGTWLVLGSYLFVFVILPRFSGGARVLFCGLLVGLAVLVGLRFPERVTEAIRADIRLPLYAGTARLITDNPWLGVGPGNFRRDFVLYRSTAHKARAVAASVTEHPHNEWLHQSATLGIAAGILWLGVMVLPLLLPIPRGTGLRLVHFSAWMLVGHSMLDKVLVQPPTSLLAGLFVGILWRHHLPMRALPQRRPAWLAKPALALALVLACGGIYVLSRDVRCSILFRRAYLAEAVGQDADAYDAYDRATLVDPGNVRTHAYAGICANNRLRNPELALPHLQRAIELEPDFAHLNGEIGLALGNLNRHHDALPHFLREAQLYPFSVQAHQRLFLCAAATGTVPGLSALHRQVLALQYRQAELALGEQRLAELSWECLLALRRGHASEALQTATTLCTPADPRGAESSFYRLLQDRDAADALVESGFGLLDLAYWQNLLQLQRHLHTRRITSPLDLRDLANELTTDAAARRPTFSRLGRLAGFQVLQVTAPGTADMPTNLFEIRREDTVWLLDLDSGKMLAGNPAVALFDTAPLRHAFGIPDIESLQLLMHVDPLRFLGRTMALSHILAQHAGRHAPSCQASPSASLLTLASRIHSERAALADRAMPPRITVDFSPDSFAEMLNWIRERQAAAASPP